MGADYEAMKRRAAETAVEQVADGMVVGLGTGSTTAYAIADLGRRVADGLDVVGIPTSAAARRRANEAGIEVADLDAVDRVDLAIDGADQACKGTLIKGGGGAHTRERLVDAAAERFIAIADERKVVDRLDAAVPLEVLSPAARTVSAAVSDLGGEPSIRQSDATDGPAYTERGNLLIDADFGGLEDPAGLAASLDGVPGIVDHGLFVELADELLVGTPSGVDRIW